MIDTRTGRPVGAIHVHGNPSWMAVDERSGHVFVKSDGGGFPGYTKLVSTLDGASGRLLRTVVVGHDPRGRNPSQGAGDIAVDTRSGRVFVTSPYAETIGVLDARGGRLVRTIGSGGKPLSIAVDERAGRVFVANVSSGTVSVLDAASGRLVRTVAVSRHPYLMAVDDQSGRIFVIDDLDGTVSVLDAHSGALVRRVRAGVNPAATVVDKRSGRVFITSLGTTDAAGRLAGPGSVSVLDARTGALLRTLPVGVEPALVAVDERAGRAFVVNVAGNNNDALAPVRSVLPFLPRPAPPCNSYGQVITRCHRPSGSVSILDATR